MKYEGLLQLLDVDEEHKAELRRLMELYNAVVLNRELNEAVGELLHVQQQEVYGTSRRIRLIWPLRFDFG